MSLPLPVQWHLIDEEDWASSWKNTGNPRKLASLNQPSVDTNTGKIRPSDSGLIGVAFGTGNRATTQLCLESLERLDEQKRCGHSGVAVLCILSIGAVLLGASSVYAVDIDPWRCNLLAAIGS